MYLLFMSAIKFILTRPDGNVYLGECQAKINAHFAVSEKYMKKRLEFFLSISAILSSPVLTAQTPELEEEVMDGVPDFVQFTDESENMPEVPELFRDDALLDESHENRELGVNVYTAPSISKIFQQMEALPDVPEEYVLRKCPSRISTASGRLALEMGYLLADGFIAVCNGHMNDINPIALELNRYGRALGIGDKMDVHSAALLEQAKKGNKREFRRILTGTQSDVNEELSNLGDADLAHLIALGGWVRAYEASAAALCEKFSTEKAAIIFYQDAPQYFSAILRGIDPATAEKLDINGMCSLLDRLAAQMALPEGAEPTLPAVEQLKKTAEELSVLIAGKEYAH